VLVLLAVFGVALSALSIVAMTASMAGVVILDVDRASIWAMIFETPMGTAWSVQMGALAMVAIILVRPRAPAVPALLGAVALGSLAWTGHGAAGEGSAGTVQLGWRTDSGARRCRWHQHLSFSRDERGQPVAERADRREKAGILMCY
jgi:putative copper resistance protein D